MTPIKLVAFDLDGTLVDSAPDIARAIDTGLKTMGRPAPGVEKVLAWVGEGLTKLLKRALTGELDGEPDPALVATLKQEFHRAYAQQLCVDTRLYPGAREALDELRDKLPLACITNKPTAFTLPLLDALGIRDHFGLVLSGDSFATMKPHPTQLLYAAQHFQVAPQAACMVGDSRNDILAAKAAGFHAVAVAHGYRQGEDLMALGAEVELQTLAELPAWLASLPAAG